jgi:hypothetical protein
VTEPTLADFRLSSGQRLTLGLLTRVVVTDDVLELGILEDVVDSVELFMRSIPTPFRLGLVAGLHAFEQSARAVPSSLGRSFSQLPLGKAEAHFARWWESKLAPMHQLAKGARMLVTFGYYEHPRVREKLGYTPDEWIAKVSRERQEKFADEIAANDARMLASDPFRLPTVEVEA